MPHGVIAGLSTRASRFLGPLIVFGWYEKGSSHVGTRVFQGVALQNVTQKGEAAAAPRGHCWVQHSSI